MLLFPLCLVFLSLFFFGDGFLLSPSKRIGVASYSRRGQQDPVEEAIDLLRYNSGDPKFLKQKWLELAIHGRRLFLKVDSSITGSESNLFFGLASYFSALDFLTVYLVGDHGSTTFSSLTVEELTEATIKEPLPQAWTRKFFKLKQFTIPVKFSNKSVRIRPSRIWAGIKHRGVVASHAVDVETLQVGGVEFSKLDILQFMDEGLEVIKSFDI